MSARVGVCVCDSRCQMRCVCVTVKVEVSVCVFVVSKIVSHVLYAISMNPLLINKTLTPIPRSLSTTPSTTLLARCFSPSTPTAVSRHCRSQRYARHRRQST